MCNFSHIIKSIEQYEKDNEKLDDEIYHLLYDNFLPLFDTSNDGATYDLKEYIEKDKKRFCVEIEVLTYICDVKVIITIHRLKCNSSEKVETIDMEIIRMAIEQRINSKHSKLNKINTEKRTLVDYFKGLI